MVASLSFRERYGLGRETSEVVVPALSLRSRLGREGRIDVGGGRVDRSDTWRDLSSERCGREGPLGELETEVPELLLGVVGRAGPRLICSGLMLVPYASIPLAEAGDCGRREAVGNGGARDMKERTRTRK